MYHDHHLVKQGLVVLGIAVTLSMITVQTANAMLLSASGAASEPATCPNPPPPPLIIDSGDIVLNKDPCQNIIILPDDDDEDEEDEEDEEDNDKEGDEGVQNKLDNINDSTNDEDAPIRQPDNVDSDNNNDNAITQQPQQFSTPQDNNGNGLVDACLQSGFSVAKCNNIVKSTNPGGVCTTTSIVGIACPQIQDPAKTYGDPEGALAESERKIDQTQNAIDGFDRLYPPSQQGKTIGNLGGFR